MKPSEAFLGRHLNYYWAGDKLPSRREVLRMIAQDAELDAKGLDGKPFDGLAVGTQFGNHGASIAALAGIIASLLPEDEK